MRNISGAVVASLRPKAACKAERWRAGSDFACFSIGPTAWWSAAKGQMCLGCHAAEAEYAHSTRLSAVLRNLKQCRFSDPWFATDDQCGSAVADTVDQPVNKGNIVLAPIENG